MPLDPVLRPDLGKGREGGLSLAAALGWAKISGQPQGRENLLGQLPLQIAGRGPGGRPQRLFVELHRHNRNLVCGIGHGASLWSGMSTKREHSTDPQARSAADW
jgi:hypothetical protein